MSGWRANGADGIQPAIGFPARVLHELRLANDKVRLVIPHSENWPFHCLACRQPLEHVAPNAGALILLVRPEPRFSPNMDRPIDPPKDHTESLSRPSDLLGVDMSLSLGRVELLQGRRRVCERSKGALGKHGGVKRIAAVKGSANG